MRFRRRTGFLARLLAGLLVLGVMTSTAGEALAKKKPKREVPDYDGRPKPPPTAGQVLIWIPRVVVFPVYALSEFVIRRPLGWLVTTAERKKWPALVVNFFSLGTDRKVALVPTFLIDFGFRPSFGLFFFWRDALTRGNSFTLRAATGGRNWLSLTAADKLSFPDDAGFVKLRFQATRRPDRLFWGIGGDASKERFRYADDLLEGELRTEYHLWRRTRVGVWAGLRSVRFREGCCFDDEDLLDTAVDKGFVEEPPGYADGYSVFYYGGFGLLDTRSKDERGNGIVVAAFAEHAASFLTGREGHWVKYGAAAAGFLDITGTKRIVGLGVTAIFTDPLDDQEIPFTELASLGGGGGGDNFTHITPMRGFLDGRLRDHSAIAATLDYEWPIWIFLSGYLRLEVGNVFGDHLEGFSFGDLRLSFGGGVRTSELGDNPFDIMFAFGTEPFRDGGSVESFRFVIGTTRGF